MVIATVIANYGLSRRGTKDWDVVHSSWYLFELHYNSNRYIITCNTNDIIYITCSYVPALFICNVVHNNLFPIKINIFMKSNSHLMIFLFPIECYIWIDVFPFQNLHDKSEKNYDCDHPIYFPAFTIPFLFFKNKHLPTLRQQASLLEEAIHHKFNTQNFADVPQALGSHLFWPMIWTLWWCTYK